MATSKLHPADRPVRPATVEGDGLDAYPTYRDGPVPPHVATDTKPTDVRLPRSRRTSGVQMLIALALIGAAVVAWFVLGAYNFGRTTDEAMTPGDPAATAPAVSAAPSAADSSNAEGVLESNEEVQTGTSPGTVEATPGPIDVPGGEATTPVPVQPAAPQ